MRSLRKGLAIAGLAALGLIGYQLMVDQIDLVAAAQRATAVMFVLLLLQWITKVAVAGYVKSLETQIAAGEQTEPEQIELHRE